MPTEKQSINIKHKLADIRITPHGDVNRNQLKQLICMALNHYLDKDTLPVSVVHQAARQRHGEQYQTPGYYLKLYRLRADFTQAGLAEKLSIKQHHLSEMENNKRPIGKKCALKISNVLHIDYRQLL